MDKGVSSYEHVNKSDSSRSVEGRHVIRITIQGEPLGVGIFKDKEGNWLFPDEVESKNDKDFHLKKDATIPVTVGPSESMSKSKKNIVDPQKIFENFGADAVRVFILSDSPPEKDIQWSTKGIEACYKFIQKCQLITITIVRIIVRIIVIRSTMFILNNS